METDVRVGAVVADAADLERVGRRAGVDPEDLVVFGPAGDPATETGGGTVVEPFDLETASAALAAANLDRVVLGPGLPFDARALRERLPDRPVTAVAPARRSRDRLLGTSGLVTRGTVFLLSTGFYLLLGEPTPFDLVTGVATGVLVAALLGRVTLVARPTATTLRRLARAVVVLPYVAWAVVAANLSLALVLVDPRLPIDPSVERLAIAADSDLERAAVANAVTLTPGTVAVDVDGSTLVVHTLTAGSRADLLEGRLFRAIRYVFAGREAAAAGHPTPPAATDGGEVPEDGEDRDGAATGGAGR